MKESGLKRLLAPLFSERRRGSTLVERQEGQAMLEYLLLIVIVMAITFGALYQFSTAFQAFARSYFGDYLTCLFEAGELPTTSGGAGVCAANYSPFSLSKGRPYEGAGGGGSSGGSGAGGGSGSGGPNGGQTGQDGRGQNGRRGSQGQIGSQGRDSGNDGQSSTGEGGERGRFVPVSSSGGSGGSYSSGNDADFLGRKGQKAGQGSLIALSQGEKEAGEKEGRGYGSFSSSATSSRTSADDQNLGRLRFIPVREEKETLGSLAPATVPLNSEDTRGAKGSRVPGSVGGKKGDQLQEADVGLTLPNFLRYLVIAAILIAIVLFLGGQALAFKKSSEK